MTNVFIIFVIIIIITINFVISITNIIITIIIIIIIITIFVILLLLWLSVFSFIIGPIRPEGSPLGRSLTQGCCELKEYVCTQTCHCDPSIQPRLELLVNNWMAEFCYGLYHL